MQTEVKALIEDNAQVLSMRLSFDRDTVEGKWRVNWFVLLMREDNLNSLLGNVGVEFHFPLARPVSKANQYCKVVSVFAGETIRRHPGGRKIILNSLKPHPQYWAFGENSHPGGRRRILFELKSHPHEILLK